MIQIKERKLTAHGYFSHLLKMSWSPLHDIFLSFFLFFLQLSPCIPLYCLDRSLGQECKFDMIIYFSFEFGYICLMTVELRY